MNEEKLHEKLPIGQNEKILKVIRHHWFAYVGIYCATGVICLLIVAAIIFVTTLQSSLGLSNKGVIGIVILGIASIILVLLFSMIPVWMKKQELLVLTQEALLQLEKPSVFASKVSQLNLVHLADVTVHQNAFGSLFNFGKITVETPGEQDNYEFTVVADPRTVAKAIIEAHENYAAALESGQIKTTLGERPPMPGTAWREAPDWPAQPTNSSQSSPGVQSPSVDSSASQQPNVESSQPSLSEESVDPNKLKEY